MSGWGMNNRGARGGRGRGPPYNSRGIDRGHVETPDIDHNWRDNTPPTPLADSRSQPSAFSWTSVAQHLPPAPSTSRYYAGESSRLPTPSTSRGYSGESIRLPAPSTSRGYAGESSPSPAPSTSRSLGQSPGFSWASVAQRRTPPAPSTSRGYAGSSSLPANQPPPVEQRQYYRPTRTVGGCGGRQPKQSSKGGTDALVRGYRGRGRGGGPRALPKGLKLDTVVSRPAEQDGTKLSKQAKFAPTKVLLTANYFKVEKRPDWGIYHYHVDFFPEVTTTNLKKELFSVLEGKLGEYIFDGGSMFTFNRIHEHKMTVQVNKTFELRMKFVGELLSTDYTYLQVLNLLTRESFRKMGLIEQNRNFFDSKEAINYPAHHIKLWPGYKSTIRSHEQDILLGVDVIHKVIRVDNCLDFIKNLQAGGMSNRLITQKLANSVVLTGHSNKTYRIDDIAWNYSPKNTFEVKDPKTKTSFEINYVEYFQNRYGVYIQDVNQPMLVSRPTKRDLHRGQTSPVLLPAELCQMTGLTDDMRTNEQLMKAISEHFKVGPTKRVQKLGEFMKKMLSSPQVQQNLEKWRLKFSNKLVTFEGHVMPKEKINFKDASKLPDDNYEWDCHFKGSGSSSTKMQKTVPLSRWAVICPANTPNRAKLLVSTLKSIGVSVGFNVSEPAKIQLVQQLTPIGYVNAVDAVMNIVKTNIQIIVIILPYYDGPIYNALKKRTVMEFGVITQCIQGKRVDSELMRNIVFYKLAVQINTKVGGTPWTVDIPFKNGMVIGFDVYHPPKGQGRSLGAMVSSTSNDLTKCFSCASFHNSREELSDKMGADFTKCLDAYYKANKKFPNRIFFYRDGVADGQLQYVKDTELQAILTAINQVYTNAGIALPRFTFIVVTKRISTRFFNNVNGRLENPCPGTVVDDVITLPERYDYYMVSQQAKDGSTSPTNYNILYDTSSLDIGKIHTITFKLCHLYYNWNGTVAVPAHCQNAHKLAYFAGQNLGCTAPEFVSNKPYFI